MSKLILSLTLFGLAGAAFGQNFLQTIDLDEPLFNTSPLPEIEDELPASFFFGNRERLRDTMPDDAFVALFSAPVRQRSNDIDFPFYQDADFYYFTGINEPNSLMLIFKTPVKVNGQWASEILFIEERDAKKETWTGKMLSEEEAKEISGAQLVLPNTQFKSMALPLHKYRWAMANEVSYIERDDKEHAGDLASLVKHFMAKCERDGIEVRTNEAEDLFALLRQRKQPEELKIMKQAIDITCEAHKNAMRAIKPGITEYQVEAVIEYTFRINGAQGEAFPSIVASGRNGSIMHYTKNDAILIPGDLVVIDIGAQYQNYAADVTRTVPVSGVFSEEQAAIYQLVLDAQTVAIRYATPGYKFWTPHEEAYRTIGKGLIKLGIIKEWSEIGNYFIHGTSHYLGLDVHDAGLYSSLKPGDVITIEPGIYIPEGSPCDPKWWNIFVRIEDDVLVTDGPVEVLSESAPKTIRDIEVFMAKSSTGLAE